MALRDEQVRRYSRHILLPDVGGRGQRALLEAAVAVPIGPGRSAEVVAAVYLAAAGVGTLELEGECGAPLTADETARGLAYGAADAGTPRGAALRARLTAINPDVVVHEGRTRADAVALAHPPVPAAAGADLAADLIRGGAVAMATIRSILDRAP